MGPACHGNHYGKQASYATAYRAYSRRAGPSPAYQPTHPIHRRTNGRIDARARPAALMMGSFNAAGGIGRCPATVRSAVHGHGQ